MGEQVKDLSAEALLEQLKTIEGAQNLVNQALSQIKGTRRGDDYRELSTSEHEQA